MILESDLVDWFITKYIKINSEYFAMNLALVINTCYVDVPQNADTSSLTKTGRTPMAAKLLTISLPPNSAIIW
jgi:hypothetical protein